MFSESSMFAGIWGSIALVIHLAWVYAIGIKMNSLLPTVIRPGTKFFKIHWWLLLGIILFAYNILSYSTYSPLNSNSEMIFFLGFGLIVVYLEFSIWMFAARMLESMIEGEIVNRSDSLKAFFCFWIFPIGVWYIQPAVHRVLAKYEPNAAGTDSVA